MLVAMSLFIPRFDYSDGNGGPTLRPLGYSCIWCLPASLPGHQVKFDLDRWIISVEAVTGAWVALLVVFGRKRVITFGKIILTIYAVALIGMVVYPRWVVVYSTGPDTWDVSPVGRALLWRPPDVPEPAIRIDYDGWGIQLLSATAVTAVLFFWIGSKRLRWWRRRGDQDWENRDP